MSLNEKAPGGKYDDLPLEEMTYEELRNLNIKNNTEMAEIRAQIDRQTADFIELGQSGDFRWTTKAKAALRFKGAYSQKIAKELSKKKQVQKQTNIVNAENEDRRFRKAAHHYLSGTDFDAIKQLANKMDGTK